MPAIATLTDSTALLDDPDALRARFAADGYLFLPGAVDADAVLGVRRDVLATVAERGWLAPGTERDDARPGDVAHHEGSDGFWPAYIAIQRLESFHRLAHHPDLLRAMTALFGADVLPHPQKIARISFPHPRFFTAPHQDYRYIQGTADFVTAWLPLGTYSPEHGGLRVLERSFDGGLLPVHQARGPGGLAVDVDEHDPRWRTATFAPGDVVVFGSLTVHGAIPNGADALRLSVDYRYQLASDPIAPPSLGPHYAFADVVPGWDDLTTAWSSRAWIEAPENLELSRFRRPDADLDVPASRWWR